MSNFTREDFLAVIESLIEADTPIYCHGEFRKGMERDQNLYVNQVIREANHNVAFKSVRFEFDPESDDAQFWSRIDASRHSEFIEETAASAILKMAQRFELT